MSRKSKAVADLAQAQQEYQAGRYDRALGIYDTLLAAEPGLVPALVNRGVVLRALGRAEDALASYKQALELAPDNGQAWANLANLMSHHGKWTEAADAYGRAAAVLPQQAAALRLTAANCLLSAGDTARARPAFATLSRHAATGLPALIGLCGCYRRDRQIAAALALAERIAQSYPQDARSHSNLAETLFVFGRFAEAEVPLRRALALNPDDLAIRCRLGQLMVSCRQWDRAEHELAEVLRRDPDHLDARLGWARLRLLRGEIPDAWNDYSWRWRRPGAQRARFAQPEWNGEPLPDATLLIYSEQGLGDTIQFCRFIERAAALVGRVVVLAPPPLARLLDGVAGIAQLVAAGSALPEFDRHIPLMDLPRVLSAGLADIGCRVPYVKAPGDPKLRRRVQLAGFRVGIVWAGNPAHDNDSQRSVTLDRFLPLLRHPEVRLIGLQKGARAEDAAAFADLLPNLGDALTDMGATAAVLEELDLVITVDSAVAHLAGALGRPVWMLTPYAPDWRWGGLGEDTPWYPTMRLLRQPAPGDWDSVFRQIDLRLADLLQPGRGELLRSAAKAADGKPRFVMELPRHLLRDAGISFLRQRELHFRGYEASTRAFLDAHLQAGDIFIDVGAHWGLMSLHAATAHPSIRVLAIEASPDNFPHLRRSIAINGLGGRVQAVHSGAWDGEGTASVLPQSTMGHAVRPGDGPGPAVTLATVDSLLAAQPGLAEGRVVMKVDVEGAEPEVLTGSRALLTSGRLAALIWERGQDYDAADLFARLCDKLDELSALGFTHWRFAHEDAGGPLIPYVPGPDLTNIFSLAPGIAPAADYVTDASRPLPIKPARPQAGEAGARADFVRRLMAAQAPDGGYWAHAKVLEAGADERAKLAARLLDGGAASVLDLGAGLCRLRAALPAGTAYTAVDLLPWHGVSQAINLDAGGFPAGRWDAAALLAVLPHLHHAREVLARTRQAAGRLVLSYPTTDAVAGELLRRARGYFNDFDRADMAALLAETGWQIEREAELGEETVWLCR